MIVRNFEYLLALNQERHFARAAAVCRVSQPTLSAGIKQLEEDMDVRIVKRGRRFEGFTPEGERVLAWAQQMMDDCMRLKQELHAFKEQAMKGPFRVGVLPATMALASVLSVPFSERAPELQVSIETYDALQLLHKIRQGELDVAITHLDETAGEGVDSHSLYRESMFFFTQSSSYTEPRLVWERVALGPLCLLRDALPLGMEHRLQSTSSVIYTDSIAVLAAHVASGKWATILPQSLASSLTNKPELRAFALGKELEQATVGFVAAKQDPLPAAVHAWIELAHTKELVTEIRRMLKAHEPYLLKNKPVKR